MPKIDHAQRVIDFVETLKTPDGTLVEKPFILRPWQIEMIRSVYGPRDVFGKRIVRQALFSAGRKNGKTAMISAICLAHLCGPEAIRNGQLFSVAYDREQSGILFKYMAAMINFDEELKEQLNIVAHNKKIYDPVSGSEFCALSSETKGKHGKSSSFIAYDELAQFGSDRNLYDVMHTSTGAHEDPLEWIFSTQAPDDKAILSELIDYGKRINSGERQDPTFVSFFYEVPSDEPNIWSEECWALANPALGDFRSISEMRDYATKAQQMPSAENTFRNLYLNQRIDASEHFLSPDVWKACGAAPILENFEDRECHGGLDLSSKNDLTSLVLVAEDDDGYFDVQPFFWTPGDGLREREKRDRAPYCLWRDQGFLIAKPGKTIDYRWVARKIGELINNGYRIASIKFDRWKIHEMLKALEDEGIDAFVYGKGEGCDWHEDSNEPRPAGFMMIPHGQGFKDMNAAVECVEDLVKESKLRHGMHPVLLWCASNTRIQSDPAENRKFDKLKSTGRIDGMVALAMALNGARTKIADEEPSVYEKRGVLFF